MGEDKYSTEDIVERFRKVFVREMTREENRGYFLADALLPSGEHLEKKDQS
jgi:hypothetical protein